MHRFLFLLLFLTAACNTPKNLPVSETISKNEFEGDGILFVLYQISESEDFVTASMDQGMLQSGKLKEDMKSTGKESDTDILILVAKNEREEIIDEYYFSNPLYERIEYVKDDQGNMAVQEVNHEKKELIARLNVDDSISQLQLFHKNSDKKKRLIHSINIQ